MKNREQKSRVCVIANKLCKQGYSRSSAMRRAWELVKSQTVESKVAGVTFENRQTIIERLTHYNANDINVFFERETDSQYDINAIKVMVNVKDSRSICVGYIPKTLALLISPLIDAKKDVKGKFQSVTGKLHNYHNYGLLIKISV